MADEPDDDEIDEGQGPEAVEQKGPTDKLDSSRGWLSLITQAEKQFNTWQEKSDTIDRVYANMDRLANDVRDREFQMFWANVQVLGPSIYSRPPVPVIVPRFKDGKQVARVASEMLERAVAVNFEMQDMDGAMRQVRDDLNVVARGQLWIRYEAAEKGYGGLGQRVCIDWTSRRDFLHEPARYWPESDWSAKRSWLTKREARKRFFKTSDDAYKGAAYEVQKDAFGGKTDIRLKAGFWELWSESQNKVVWVTEGVDVVLDQGKPHLDLQDFFPCPRPAYATLQRNSLIPVPDYMFYRDQLDEINSMTARIASLSDAVRLKGFYPGGAGEISDAVEAAMARQDDNAILIPISNWAMLGNGAAKDMIVWLPLADIVAAITALIAERKELFSDVYQIMGISDIMRGLSDPSETLGAQELKGQYGSVRIRDKKDELVRVARDVTRITAEIMAENFTAETLLEMSQMDIPSNADIAKQAKPIQQHIKALQAELAQAATSPEVKAFAQENPDKAKEIIGQVQQQMQELQGQLGKLGETVTIEQVMKFLRDNRTRAFTLDIETDSTIQPDENAEKQRMTEYVTAIGGFFQQAIPVVKEVPQAAPLIAAVFKKVNSTFRVGRDFQQIVDEFATQMQQIAATPPQQGPTPEQIQAQADAAATQQKAQLDAEKAKGEALKAQSEAQLAQAQLKLDTAIAQKDAELESQRIELDRYKAELAADTTLKAAAISADQTNNAQQLEGVLDQQVGIADQRHEQTMQAADHAHEQAILAQEQQHEAQQVAQDQQHQQAMQGSQQQADAVSQDSAQQAAVEAAAAKPTTTGE